MKYVCLFLLIAHSFLWAGGFEDFEQCCFELTSVNRPWGKVKEKNGVDEYFFNFFYINKKDLFSEGMPHIENKHEGKNKRLFGVQAECGECVKMPSACCGSCTKKLKKHKNVNSCPKAFSQLFWRLFVVLACDKEEEKWSETNNKDHYFQLLLRVSRHVVACHMPKSVVGQFYLFLDGNLPCGWDDGNLPCGWDNASISLLKEVNHDWEKTEYGAFGISQEYPDDYSVGDRYSSKYIGILLNVLREAIDHSGVYGSVDPLRTHTKSLRLICDEYDPALYFVLRGFLSRVAWIPCFDLDRDYSQLSHDLDSLIPDALCQPGWRQQFIPDYKSDIETAVSAYTLEDLLHHCSERLKATYPTDEAYRSMTASVIMMNDYLKSDEMSEKRTQMNQNRKKLQVRTALKRKEANAEIAMPPKKRPRNEEVVVSSPPLRL